jgi:hypothetical protein
LKIKEMIYNSLNMKKRVEPVVKEVAEKVGRRVNMVQIL